MRVVWKFEFPLGCDQIVQMPSICQIVEVRFHPVTRLVTMWGVCKSESPLVQKEFMTVGTGQSYDREDEQIVQFIGTVFDDEENEVWHIFQLLGKRCPGPQ